MGKFILDGAMVKVNAVDLSDHVRSVELNMSAEDVDSTHMGSGGSRDRVQGLRDNSFVVNFQQDFDAAKVDATLWALFSGGSAFLVEVAGDGTAISSTNPKWSATCIMTEYQPLSGEVGDLSMTQVTFPTKGTVTRSTA